MKSKQETRKILEKFEALGNTYDLMCENSPEELIQENPEKIESLLKDIDYAGPLVRSALEESRSFLTEFEEQYFFYSEKIKALAKD